MRSLEEYGVIQRIAQASYGLAFYLWKTLIPARLIPVYEIPVEMNAFESRLILAAAAVVAITVALLVLRRRWPSGLTLWLVYVITVSPVLGLAQSGPQLVADRYSYISCMTWSLLCGTGLAWCLRRQGERQATPTALPAIVISVLAILTLAALTWRQTLIWRTSSRLWNHTLAVAPDCYTAHGNLGVLLKQQGDLEGALAHYHRSWEIKPDDPQTLNNIGSICQRQGKLEEALGYYERAREIRPDALLVQVNIANCYRQLKRYEEALRILREVVQRERFNYRALTGLGQTLIAVGDPDQAIFYFRQAIEVQDTYAYAHAGLGTAHRMKEEWAQGHPGAFRGRPTH